MTQGVFADTFFWIARFNTQDRFHQKAVELSQSLSARPFITTEDVIVEVLNYFSKRGSFLRQTAAQAIRRLQLSSTVHILPQSRLLFDIGFALYEARLDKGYSLTDCISMVAMREEGLTEVLTYDHHFEQEGFRCLFRDDH